MSRSHVALLAGALCAGLLTAAAVPAAAFGTYNSPTIMGQQAEHERITRVLVSDGFEPRTLDLLAGTAGKLGAVGAPDDAVDSSLVPGKGLGPGEKHCDNGDYLDVAGYPQSRDAAAAQLTTCFGYYEQLLDRAVEAAGAIVDDAGTVDVKEGTATSCSFPYSLGKRDKTAKCEVLNRLGRALHLSEDFWSHTNWADFADPGQPISIKNPPGLGRIDVPAGLRYPGGGSAGVPDGLISGCDDSVPVLGAIECKGRVTHSVLAKDNGNINPGSCAGASPTSKYARAQVTSPYGQQNFSLAVCGAMVQTQQTWRDLRDAIVATYGDERGGAIVSILTSDAVPAAMTAASPTASPTDTASASASATASASPSESAGTPAEESAAETDASATPADASADEATGDIDRQAAVADGNVVDAPSSGSNVPMILLAVAVAMGLIALAWYAVSRRRNTGSGPSAQ
jgi:hypothetical protein